MWTLIEKMVAIGDGRRGARVRERQGRKRIRPLWSWVKGNRSSLFFLIIVEPSSIFTG
jgi:hypothetical protein